MEDNSKLSAFDRMIREEERQRAIMQHKNPDSAHVRENKYVKKEG